jgi:hypothetical protein
VAKRAKVATVPEQQVSPAWSELAQEELALKPLWAALLELDPQGPINVLALARERRTTPWALAARGLLDVLEAHKKSALGMLPRPKRLGDEMAKSYTGEIYREIGRAIPAADQWVSLNFNTRVVQRHAEHPGNAPKVVLLDVRSPVEWLDVTGRLTERSVLAYLLGYARPKAIPGEPGMELKAKAAKP